MVRLNTINNLKKHQLNAASLNPSSVPGTLLGVLPHPWLSTCFGMHQNPGPYPGVFNLAGLGWGPRICLPSKFPGDVMLLP